ncbi:MAG: tetratricopeptide repeat protein, partial [Steroidobacter sp.]
MNNNSSQRAVLMCLVIGTLFSVSACVTTREELGKKDDVAAASANMQLAISAMQTNDLELAKSKIDKALSQDPHSASVRYVAGLLYARIKEYGKADSYYSQAIDLEPHNGDIINGYAAYLCNRKNYSKGEKLALRAAEDPLYKSPYVALLNAGICAKEEGRLNVAEDYFRRALKLQPNFSAALLQM